MGGESLCAGHVHGEEGGDEGVEELFCVVDFVDGVDGLAGCDDLVEMEPAGDELAAAVAEESALEAGLGADEEGAALGSETVSFVGVFGEEVEGDEGVGDGFDAAWICA